MTFAIDDVSVKRGGRTVIAGVSLTGAAGEVVGLVGKNGCGKSSLLMAVAGVLEPAEGRITIAGASVWGSHRERTRARAQLGYVPELADPPGFLLGGELWALCAAARSGADPEPGRSMTRGRSGADPEPGRSMTRSTRPLSAELTAALGLDELRDVALERMSLGQRRRACIAAALLGPPHLLVLDEPDNGLDARRLDALVELVRAHAAAGRSALVATHDAAMLDRLGARVVSLDV
jgi:ABC-type multidrug transport system ATPase subunit